MIISSFKVSVDLWKHFLIWHNTVEDINTAVDVRGAEDDMRLRVRIDGVVPGCPAASVSLISLVN